MNSTVGTTIRILAVSLACTSWLPAAYAQTNPTQGNADQSRRNDITWAVGAGGVRSPAWLGSSHTRYDFLPYFAFNWRDIVELSITDGLSIDLLQGSTWHGGLTGTWRRGRSTHDLGALAEAGIAPLSNAWQAGTYLEHVPVKNLTLGISFTHDIQSTGAAYGDAYIEWDIPVLKPVEHSLKLAREFMNRSAMQRFFSVPANAAAALGVQPYQPSAGASGTRLSYEAFLPTSRSTGFAIGFHWTRLASKPASSPLVRDYGDKTQRTYLMAFLVHF
ncbi:MAG: MipA/OmpV family protein [Betaproteobacteria bacterium]|nr:MipA/OmpV family protein [Betaproteobacteria bacterium]